MVQFPFVGTWSDTDHHNGNTGRSHLVRDGPRIFGISSRSLGPVSQQHDNLVGSRSRSVGFREKFVLRDAKSFIDSCDGTHQWNGINSTFEVCAVVEIVESDAEFRIVRERYNSRSVCSVPNAEVLSDFFQEVFFPLVVVS
jgi:hypothetical protein